MYRRGAPFDDRCIAHQGTREVKRVDLTLRSDVLTTDGTMATLSHKYRSAFSNSKK